MDKILLFFSLSTLTLTSEVCSSVCFLQGWNCMTVKLWQWSDDNDNSMTECPADMDTLAPDDSPRFRSPVKQPSIAEESLTDEDEDACPSLTSTFNQPQANGCKVYPGQTCLKHARNSSLGNGVTYMLNGQSPPHNRSPFLSQGLILGVMPPSGTQQVLGRSSSVRSAAGQDVRSFSSSNLSSLSVYSDSITSDEAGSKVSIFSWLFFAVLSFVCSLAIVAVLKVYQVPKPNGEWAGAGWHWQLCEPWLSGRQMEMVYSTYRLTRWTVGVTSHHINFQRLPTPTASSS